MSIYEITKLDDNVHVQKKTPNPQIYKLFEMGAELEQVVDSLDPGSGDDYYTKDEVDSKLANKQNTLTFDNTPTAGSTNPVTSGGIELALKDYIKTVEVNIIGGSGGGASVNIPANGGVWVDCSPYIIANCPAGYKPLVPYLITPSFVNTSNVYILCTDTGGRFRVVNRTAEAENLVQMRVVATYIKDI